jgi:hypothetical protein
MKILQLIFLKTGFLRWKKLVKQSVYKSIHVIAIVSFHYSESFDRGFALTFHKFLTLLHFFRSFACGLSYRVLFIPDEINLVHPNLDFVSFFVLFH